MAQTSKKRPRSCLQEGIWRHAKIPFSVLDGRSFLTSATVSINISIKQNLKLLNRFCLLGGEEWKQLAESFGMSYNEIRFLDKRTTNPCDVVLDLIAKHRYLMVGELYDRLVKSGLPGSADLLWIMISCLLLFCFKYMFSSLVPRGSNIEYQGILSIDLMTVSFF